MIFYKPAEKIYSSPVSNNFLYIVMKYKPLQRYKSKNLISTPNKLLACDCAMFYATLSIVNMELFIELHMCIQ